jgi:hypothetical protein
MDNEEQTMIKEKTDIFSILKSKGFVLREIKSPLDVVREMGPIAEGKYIWNYGKLGQILFEKSDHIAKLRPKGCRLTDGHEPRIKFSNLKPVAHLDTIIYEPRSKKIRAICEVKATVNKLKREFDANGVCGFVFQKALKVGIPVFLAIVRFKALPPESIITDAGYDEHLEYLRSNPDQYQIEFYAQNQFELVDNRFVIR